MHDAIISLPWQSLDFNTVVRNTHELAVVKAITLQALIRQLPCKVELKSSGFINLNRYRTTSMNIGKYEYRNTSI